MPQRTWFITGVNSGFGRELTRQLLERGDRVVGTVRDRAKVADLLERHPDTFGAEVLDLTDTGAIHETVDRAFAEAAPFGIGVTIVEPGGARTGFRHGRAPGDPARMAARIIESADHDPAPLRLVLGSQALTVTLETLRARIADFETQHELAASTDHLNNPRQYALPERTTSR
jgi:NAD(P)-dependent dehydrogenase (short-subunit alcohol dehydrogenase family)